jgi:hypothetical protein
MFSIGLSRKTSGKVGAGYRMSERASASIMLTGLCHDWDVLQFSPSFLVASVLEAY